MTYPTDAVDRLQAWSTANFDLLPQGAVIDQFSVVAQDLSTAITFSLTTLQKANADADAITSARTQAQTDADRISTARANAEASELSASQSAALAASRAADFTPAALSYLFENGGHPWPAL